MQYWPVMGNIYGGSVVFLPALFPAFHIGAVVNNNRKHVQKERKKGFFFETLHSCCVLHIQWVRESIMWSASANSHTSEWQEMCLCSGGWCHKCRCDFSPETAHWCCWRQMSPPPPLSSLHYSPQLQLKRHRFSLAHLLQSGLNWTCPVSSRTQRLSGLLTPIGLVAWHACVLL